MQEKLIYGTFNTPNEYFSYLEFYNKQDSSLCWVLSRLATEVYAGDSFSTIYNQNTFGSEETNIYSVGGVASFDVYNNHKEYMEYREDIRIINKTIKVLTI